MRHFYKFPNHGVCALFNSESLFCLIQTHKGACYFWKWEDAYEEFLQKLGMICQDQTVESTPSVQKYMMF
jgi:hypothetical protein